MKKNKKERLAAKAAAAQTEVKEKTKTVKPDAKKAPAKNKKAEEATLNKQTATATVKRITNKKDLIYKYPKEADNLAARKKFRAEVRRNKRAMEKEIARLLSSDKKEDKVLLDKKSKDFDAYLAKHTLIHS